MHARRVRHTGKAAKEHKPGSTPLTPHVRHNHDHASAAHSREARLAHQDDSRAGSPPRSVSTQLLLVLLRGYQNMSRYRSPACRFTPSCSEYAVEALQHYGAPRGVRLALRRLLRCRPGGPFGYDPVPEPEEVVR